LTEVASRVKADWEEKQFGVRSAEKRLISRKGPNLSKRLTAREILSATKEVSTRLIGGIRIGYTVLELWKSQ